MQRTIVFRRVRGIDPSRAFEDVIDVVVERGVIVRAGRHAADELADSGQVRIFDGEGKWLVPGLVDLHTHLREPGGEYKEEIATGLQAAAAGGFTDVCAMPNTSPVNDTAALTEFLVLKGKGFNGTRLHPIGAITVGQKGEQLTEIGSLKKAGAVAISDDGKCVMSSAVMRAAFEYARAFDLPVIQHAEDHTLTAGAQMHEGMVSTRLGLTGWPRSAEEVIIARDLILAEYTHARYHVAHLSTAGSVRLVREAKARGIQVTAEVTPHHLLLTDEAVLRYNTYCKVNPPLREESDIFAVREGLADGTIDCIATDHAPHSALDKECEFAQAPPGMIGLETCVPMLLRLVHQSVISRMRFVEALTSAPARVVGLPIPTLREGGRADMTLIDPEAVWTVDPNAFLSRSHNTPFGGETVRGRVEMTMVNGEIVFERVKSGEMP